MKKFFDCAIIGEGTIFPRNLKTMGNKNYFDLGRKNCCFLSFLLMNLEPFKCANTSFLKFNLLTASGMALCFYLETKISKFIPLSLRLS